MARRKGKGKEEAKVSATVKHFWEAHDLVMRHGLFQSIAYSTWVNCDQPLPGGVWAQIDSSGLLRWNHLQDASIAQWRSIIAHSYLHLGLGHFDQHPEHPLAWNLACDLVVARFLAELGFVPLPDQPGPPEIGQGQTEHSLYERFVRDGIPMHRKGFGTAGPGMPDMIWRDPKLPARLHEPDWKALLATGLREAMADAIEVAAGVTEDPAYQRSVETLGMRTRAWIINHYPLLGAMAAAFRVIEDTTLCQRMSISVAAVHAEAQEIYINPAAGLNEEELRFVFAHELLHVGLAHHARCQGRDHYLWNIACDYVINAWLVEMKLGSMPAMGLLYDPELKGLSAEAIYDLIVNDLRRFRKLATLRGKGLGDMLEPETPGWWELGEGCTLDEFYRRCLAQGFQYAELRGRGFILAGLAEEIRALMQPPIPWDVALARWFEAMFAPLEKLRTYARPSRRQSSTPDIPRPSRMLPPPSEQGRTFGVVLDTSGSMDRALLARGLGAIASYAMAHEIPWVRVVFCDAAAYDAGYLSPEDIADRVKVRGRGGTILQPGVNLLEKAKDFPGDGPILVITDTECDHVVCKREHAYLVPAGRRLPFSPRGPVFEMK